MTTPEPPSIPATLTSNEDGSLRVEFHHALYALPTLHHYIHHIFQPGIVSNLERLIQHTNFAEVAGLLDENGGGYTDAVTACRYGEDRGFQVWVGSNGDPRVRLLFTFDFDPDPALTMPTEGEKSTGECAAIDDGTYVVPMEQA